MNDEGGVFGSRSRLFERKTPFEFERRQGISFEMIFETFEPRKSKSIVSSASNTSAGLGAERKKSVVSTFLEWDRDIDVLSLAEQTLPDGRVEIKSKAPSAKHKAIKLKDLRLPMSIFSGAHIETNMNILGQLMRSEVPQLQSQYIFDPNHIHKSIPGKSGNLGSKTRSDLLWVSYNMEDELKVCYQRWQQCLHNSLDRLLEGQIESFYILGSSFYDQSDELAVSPTYCFYHNHSTHTVMVLVLHCGQYVIKRILSLGAKCDRLLESDYKSIFPHHTSTLGRSLHLFGSNHILIRGEVGGRIVAHFLVDEVFNLVCKCNRKSAIPCILSSHKLAYSAEIGLDCKAIFTPPMEPPSSHPPWLVAVLTKKARLDLLSTNSSLTNATDKVIYRAKINSLLLGETLPSLLLYLKDLSLSNSHLLQPTLLGYPQLRRYTEKLFGLMEGESREEDSASPLSPLGGSLLNPMIITKGLVKPPVIAISTALKLPSLQDWLEEGKSEGADYFLLRLHPSSSKTTYLHSLSLLDGSAEYYEVLKEVRWKSTAPEQLLVIVEERPLPSLLPCDQVGGMEIGEGKDYVVVDFMTA